MADLSDVLTAIANTLGTAFYPNGTASASVINAPVRVYPGWPVPANLDADLAASTVNVSIYPLAMERVAALTSPDAQTQAITPALLSLSVSGNQITVGGGIQVGDVATISRNGSISTYAVLAADTLSSVASGIASAMGGTASGTVVTAPAGTYALSAGVSTRGTLIQPMRRIERRVQVTIWAPTPTLRDQCATLIDSAAWNASSIVMPDGTRCGLAYQGSPMTDMLEKQAIYRRDIIIAARYVSTQTLAAQTVGSLSINESTAATPVATFTVT